MYGKVEKRFFSVFLKIIVSFGILLAIGQFVSAGYTELGCTEGSDCPNTATESGTCYYGSESCSQQSSGLYTCSYPNQDSDKPNCDPYAEGDKCNYPVRTDCTSNGWECRYGADYGKPTCSNTCADDNTVNKRTAACGSDGWTCAGNGLKDCGTDSTCDSGSCCVDENNDGICDSEQTDECDSDSDCGTDSCSYSSTCDESTTKTEYNCQYPDSGASTCTSTTVSCSRDTDGDYCGQQSCQQTYDDYCDGNELVEYDSDCTKDSTTVSDTDYQYCSSGSCPSGNPDCSAPDTRRVKCAGECGCSPDYGEPCSTNTGQCTEGTIQCDGTCSGTMPSTETCNNKDDDCDGVTDENRANIANTACMSVSTTSNSGPDQGAAWIEGNRFHWADGSTEYEAYNDGNTVSTGLTGESGHAWVEGAYYHWIDQNGNERRFYGVDTGNNPSAQNGQGWIESGYLHYVDESGNERVVQ